MYVIIVYDIKEARVQRVLKICRKYFYWVQNSVFEGEITKSKLEKFKSELKKIMNFEEDSVIIYTFLSEKYSRREILGLRKGGFETII